MAVTDAAHLTLADLKKALQQTEPRAFLVPARILRRIIKNVRPSDVPGINLWIPHRKSFTVDRKALLKHVEPGELGVFSQGDLPEQVILLMEPSAEKLASQSRSEMLLRYWKLLYHIRAHELLDELVEQGELSEEIVRRKIDEVGQAEFDEVRVVLRDEHLLLPPRDNLTTWIEFVAVYTELRLFNQSLLSRYFPTIRNFEAIDAIVAEHFDPAALAAKTKLEGAEDPGLHTASELEDQTIVRATMQSLEALKEQPPELYYALMRKGIRAQEQGNGMRAAIMFIRAAHSSYGEEAVLAERKAKQELENLVRRLQAALDIESENVAQWREALEPLLKQSARDRWTVEGRLLYDLQAVCVDHEREIYTVDVVEWVLWLGTRPIKRPLPHQREVLICRHLQRSVQRLPGTRLTTDELDRLSRLLRKASRQAERILRDQFRPVLLEALESVGLQAQTFPERIAKRKIVGELLDQMVQRGFLTIGDLRDAISRNSLKLPDLSSAKEFFLGDQLLQLDRRLAFTLDGVYRRGEVYLRWQQSLTSLAFGTRPGRFITRYLALPFGGAFVILKALDEVLHHLVGPGETTEAAPAVAGHAAEAAAETHSHSLLFTHDALSMWNVLLIVAVGWFLMGLIYWPEFRSWVVFVLRQLPRLLHTVFVEWPLAVLRWKWLKRLAESWPVVTLFRFVIGPGLMFGVLIGLWWLALPLPPLDRPLGGVFYAALLAVCELVINSRIGRDAEEVTAETVVRVSHRFRNFFPAMFRLIMEYSKAFLSWVERILYMVDEWLRFRAGESAITMVTKATLGVVWFYVHYVVRFCVILLIEPQVNPIKHFPVVTVSHKIMLPLIPHFARVLTPALGSVAAMNASVVFVTSTPGVFGYLVWELKENWRLYESNRSDHLQPLIIGHHGETMSRFLRPGFHSGTIPKIYGRLRRAERKAYSTGNWAAARKHRDALHHVQASLRNFVARKLLNVLDESRCFGDCEVRLKRIHLGFNSICFELECPEVFDDPATLVFEEQSGWLVAGVRQPGWIARLSAPQRNALHTALAGFYKLAGVDFVREQFESHWEDEVPPYDIADEGLILWPKANFRTEVIYQLSSGTRLRPQVGTFQSASLPTFEDREILFCRNVIRWDAWVSVWEEDQAEHCELKDLLPGVSLLPPAAEPPRKAAESA